ncbi:MAG: hypothetical protein ACYTF1_08990 [Planctomycetota bacterium]|jgi:hypothetical protein
MKVTVLISLLTISLGAGMVSAAESKNPPAQVQYILVNIAPWQPWGQNNPDSFKKADIDAIKKAIPEAKGSHIRVGVGFIFSYLHATDDVKLIASLERFLSLAQLTDTPVFVQLDGENWWNSRPDLWNWWDRSKPGYDPDNRDNVEWTGWGPEHAIKIAWRNWGRQIRVLPPPNLMSKAYRRACRDKIRMLVPIIMRWYRKLPKSQKDLLVGIKVGHESSVGVNGWYYPDGNDLLDKPESEDPTTGLDVEKVLSRGVTQIGYAAVKTAGIRRKGELTEKDLVEVVRRHLLEQSREVARLKVPRDKLFTHVGGWKDGELLYGAALNKYSCPGWSFYKHAGDPRKDIGVQRELKRSKAPFWGAVEYYFHGPHTAENWRKAIGNTLSDPRCRLLCIYNWHMIRDKKPILEGIRQVVAAGDSSRISRKPRTGKSNIDSTTKPR